MPTSQNSTVPIECWRTQKGFWRPKQVMQNPLYRRANRKYKNIESRIEHQ
jgi:hypothetical protein